MSYETKIVSDVQSGCGCAICNMSKVEWIANTHVTGSNAVTTGETQDEGVVTITPGSTVSGNIDITGDTDMINIEVVAGQTYMIVYRADSGSTELDPFLEVKNEAGVSIGTDDDGATVTNSMLTFTAQNTGTYQIIASSFSNPGMSGTGAYTVDARQMGSDTAPDAWDGTVPAAPPTLTVGDTHFDFMEADTDVDVFKISLTAGQTYAIEVQGGADYNTNYLAVPAGELDTKMTIYDANGNQVAYNDDMDFGNGVLGSGVTLQAAATGDYYVKIETYGNTGGYTLDSRIIDLATLDPLDSIDWGTQYQSPAITVYFAQAGETFDGVTSLGWTQDQMDAAMEALDAWADVSGLTFSVATDPNGATFRLVTNVSSDYVAYMNPPDYGEEGVGVFATNWPEWTAPGGLDAGGSYFWVMLHEFGHGLGFAHPHDNGGTSEIMPGVMGAFDSYGVFNLNQGVYTTMSYNPGWQFHPDAASGDPVDPTTGTAPYDFGYQAGPGAFDIALAQQKYGVNTTYNATDTVYTLPTANAAGTFYLCIWDAGGTDSIVHNGSAAARIDLTAATLDYTATGAGVVSYVEGIYGGFTIANGAVIENATGGSGDDVLIGNDAANRLDGGMGVDYMLGGGGNDTFVVDNVGDIARDRELDGGTDLVESSVTYTIRANIENLTLTGEAAINGVGNDLANVLTGNGMVNTLRGGGGADSINGGEGADKMYGGLGNDTYWINDAGDVVIENSAAGGVDAVVCSINYRLGTLFENLYLEGSAAQGTGNDSANFIFGSELDNVLRGGGGGDQLFGEGGNDIIRGGADADTFHFDSALNAATNVDRLTDFSSADDTIMLYQSVFAGLGSEVTAGSFRLGATAQDADDRILYDQATGNIFYDADGNGAGEAVLFARLNPGTELSHLDFSVALSLGF